MTKAQAITLICGALLQACQAQEHPRRPASPETPLGTNAPRIIPQPKYLRLGAGSFKVPPHYRWLLMAKEKDKGLWEAAGRAFGGRLGDFVQLPQQGITLQLGSNYNTTIPTNRELPRWYSDPEGYLLLVGTNHLLITAQTAQGAFYALQTLAQLWQGTAAGRSCPAIEVQDWPAMRFRGVHWFPSASGVPMHLRLITNVFGALKFNRSVIQCEAARWDKHPEISAPNAVSKADLRRLVEACRACWLEPIPLINVPGHAEWVFRNGSNLDFVEDPQTPYAYCVNHPKSFAFVQDVLSECLPIFESKSCHIGHDEVTMRGRFPNPDCPRCKDQTVTALVVQHANRLSEWLRRQGVESMIWGDMLLGPGEAKDATHAKTLADARQRRAELDKKTVVVDWHYAAGVDASSIMILRESGFRVVAASWYTPENIHHLSQAALAVGAEGLLQTTWMGYFPDEQALRSALPQFSAFVLAADYAWSGRNDFPTQLGYDPDEAFRKAYAPSR